jgi:hypothetical protein
VVTFHVHREPLLRDAEFLHRHCEPIRPLLLALSPRRRAAASPMSWHHHRLLVSVSVAPTPSPCHRSSSSPRGCARAPHRASSCSTTPSQDQRGRDTIIQHVRGVEFQHATSSCLSIDEEVHHGHNNCDEIATASAPLRRAGASPSARLLLHHADADGRPCSSPPAWTLYPRTRQGRPDAPARLCRRRH